MSDSRIGQALQNVIDGLGSEGLPEPQSEVEELLHEVADQIKASTDATKEAFDAVTAADIPTSDDSDVQTKLTSYASTLSGHTTTLGGHTSQLAAIADADVPAYGIAYADNASNIALARTLSAKGMTAAAMIGAAPVTNSFDLISPWKDITRCNLADDGTVNAYYGDPTYAADGSNGQVMVRVPKFWWKLTPVVPITQPIYSPSIAAQSKAGYAVHPAFAGRAADGGDLDFICIGAYDAGYDGVSKLTSISGTFPHVSATRAQCRTRARARGANWAQMDFLAASAIQLLYLIEYANWDGQAMIGAGLTGLPYTGTHLATVATTAANDIIIATANAGTYDVGMVIGIGTTQGGNEIATNRVITDKAAYDGTNTRITFYGTPVSVAIGNMLYAVGQKTGRADALGNKSGRESGASDNRSAMCYRGIENMWGNVFNWIDGLNILDLAWAYCDDIDAYADGVMDGAYTPMTGAAPNADGHVKAMHLNDFAFRPSAIGGGTGTYIPDYYSQSSGARVLALGGAFFSGTAAGPFFWYAYSSAPSASLPFGGRLLFLPR